MKVETRNEMIKQRVAVALSVLSVLGFDSINDMKPEHNLVDDYLADSLDLSELFMAMEELFDCDISESEAEKITTLGKMFDYAEKHNLVCE